MSSNRQQQQPVPGIFIRTYLLLEALGDLCGDEHDFWYRCCVARLFRILHDYLARFQTVHHGHLHVHENHTVAGSKAFAHGLQSIINYVNLCIKSAR